jgi:hypothetical protein
MNEELAKGIALTTVNGDMETWTRLAIGGIDQ